MSLQDQVSRRAFVAGAAVTAFGASFDTSNNSGWIPLFDGRSLKGWRASENKGSWSVKDGCLAGNGGRSHLFYEGPVQGADFRNFELQVEAIAPHAANSGVYFHTRFQETNFPIKGFEVQICNSLTGRERYQPRVMTGSLYGLRNVYKPMAQDDRWFQIAIAVRGKNIQVRLDGTLLVDYTEPAPPVIPKAMETERFLDHGTFALQCHDDASPVRFRNIRVRPLPDSTPTPPDSPVPVADEVFRANIEAGRHNIPMLDTHVHLKSGLTLEQALANSRREGIGYGIAVNCGKNFPIQNDAGALEFVNGMQGAPAFIAMQAEGREWVEMFSRRAVAAFDYVFTDSMTWTDNRGKRMRLWIPEEVGTIPDKQEFMETLVDRTVGILNNEPVDVYANPTFLPATLAGEYESLWTEPRRRRVVEAAVRNQVAIEINNRYHLPSASFIQFAKAAGAKFTFGTNNTSGSDLGRNEYGLRMVKDCGLVWQDFWLPLKGPKAVERRGGNAGLRG